jgi:hypothetical protein
MRSDPQYKSMIETAMLNLLYRSGLRPGERLVTGHPGSKSHRRHGFGPDQRRRNARLRQRSALAARVATVSRARGVTHDEAVHDEAIG